MSRSKRSNQQSENPIWVSTRVVIDIETGAVLEREGCYYSGPLALCNSSGRAPAETATSNLLGQNKFAGDVIGSWWNPFQSSAGTVRKFGTSLIPKKSGELSPYAQAAYEQQKRNIERNAADATGAGIRTLAERGFGTGPSGALSSVINTTNRNAGDAETNAYEDAMGRTAQEGALGAGLLENEQQLANPMTAADLAVRANSAAAQAAAARHGMGSPLGDIGSGIQGLASTFAGIGAGGGRNGFGFWGTGS
jgi:hypothetical protein